MACISKMIVISVLSVASRSLSLCIMSCSVRVCREGSSLLTSGSRSISLQLNILCTAVSV
ncbi:Uncharacterised protein [Vibrio cholerae]|uniref:Uncharacterized protein n=1 Tax=Vibrio cholerae TaxID=666 RepID=A0A656ATC0_VIBCL|nr:Uncharacterised protein [Vibrio cholerae]